MASNNQPNLGVFRLKPQYQKKKSASLKKNKSASSKKNKSASLNKKKITCFRLTRKSNTNKGKAGSKYVVCKNTKKQKKTQKGGFVRGGSPQNFVY